VPLAALQLLGFPFRAKVAAIRTYPVTSLARFPTVTFLIRSQLCQLAILDLGGTKTLLPGSIADRL